MRTTLVAAVAENGVIGLRGDMPWRLKADLARFPKTAPIIVFTHRPLFDLKPEWEWFTSDGDAVMNALA